MILWHGRVVMRWGDQKKRYDIKSATKSFGATMLGIAVKDGKIELDAPARRYHPTIGVPPQSNVRTGWLDEITILRLATQTAGFDKPGGYEGLLFRPGTHWHYSDGGPNWLAECITLQYNRDLQEIMFERVFSPLGISHDDLRWRRNQYREHTINGIVRREFGAGIHGNASDHYGLLWWNNGDGVLANVPRDAFWAWGLYDSLIVVIPALDLVVVRDGERAKQWSRKPGQDHYHVLKPFLNPIVAAVKSAHVKHDNPKCSNSDLHAPYPPSTVITDIKWAPRQSIVRRAKGSDTWPLTWADDDALYTAYGDGWGFEPRVERKLSLGLAKVLGGPSDFRGINIRSRDAEQVGQGAAGLKASGMLMVDGVLYLCVRNAGNTRLAWSDDHGKTWKWAGWKFATSFGAPTFLNFGRNYAGARDQYVYVYSHDNDSAYRPADRMVLCRVPKNRVRHREAYEFFRHLDNNGDPVWDREIEKRGAVFHYPGNCYRSGITYDSRLKRYLWCQVLPKSTHPQGPRFQGGFGIYDAPEPWGPWTTVYFTDNWDVGPGETSRFPTKWMSQDGKTVHLVFSGDDCFSVRRAVLKTTARKPTR